jgi:hypothetical protein
VAAVAGHIETFKDMSAIALAVTLRVIWKSRHAIPQIDIETLLQEHVKSVVLAVNRQAAQDCTPEKFLMAAFSLAKSVYDGNYTNAMSAMYVAKTGHEVIRDKLYPGGTEIAFKETVTEAAHRTIELVRTAGTGSLNLEANYAYSAALCRIFAEEIPSPKKEVEPAINLAEAFARLYPGYPIYSEEQERQVPGSEFVAEVHQRLDGYRHIEQR